MNNRIKELRLYLGVTVVAFANKLGITRSYVAQAENGSISYSDVFIRRLCETFNVNEKWLRTGTGPMLVEERAAADPDGLGARIRSIRKELKLTQVELAEKIEIKQAYISEIEKGKKVPNDEIIRRLAVALDVSYDWLICGGNQVSHNSIRKALNDEEIRHIVEYLKMHDEARKVVGEVYRDSLWKAPE